MRLYRWITDSAFGDVHAVDVVFGIHKIRTAGWLGINFLRLLTLSTHIDRSFFKDYISIFPYDYIALYENKRSTTATERSNF